MRLLLILLFVAGTVQAQTVTVADPSSTVSSVTQDSLSAPANTANELAQPVIPEAVVEAKTEKVTSLPETQIPVQLDSGKKSGAQESPWFKIIAGLLTVGLIAAGAVYFMRRYMRNAGEMKNAPQIKVLTQHYLGPKKHLAIVRVAGESILIGVTDTNISMLKSLSLLDDEIPEATPKSFAGIFNKNNETADFSEPAQKPEDDFSITGIKDFVSNRLKGMRNLE